MELPSVAATLPTLVTTIVFVVIIIAVQIMIIRWLFRINEMVNHLDVISRLNQKMLAAMQTLALNATSTQSSATPDNAELQRDYARLK
jgi:hypothetical protein